MKSLHFIVSLLLPSLFLLSVVFSFSPKKCLDEQRSSLLQLQNDLYYAPNFTFSSKFELWDLNNTDCCSWDGVTCDVLGHVIELDLSYQNLSGTFHSIFNLHHLRRLNLAGNNFNTTLLSYGFHKLPNVTHLNLSSSCFHGQIPVEISFLTGLVSLDLSHQHSCFERYYFEVLNPDHSLYFYDPLPNEFQQPLKLENPDLKTLIKNLRLLKELYLGGVNISSHSSKWCETTSQLLPNLHVLSLSRCGLKGPLCSSLSTLPFLSKLFLDDNPISYLPPNFLEISSRLVSLSLRNCSLSGRFPTQILSLPKIQSIDMSGNYNLTGQLPEFPSNSALRSLSLSVTNFSGKLPESIGNFKSLTDLDLFGCNFSGSIPLSIANLSHLVKLDLGDNSFSGLIPPFHRFGVPNLAYIYLDGNKLSGSIPSSLFTLSRLEVLYIGGNSFSSTKLDMFFQLKKLRYLDLSDISLLMEGDNGSFTFPKLETLSLRSCNLTQFPEFIKRRDKLVFLDLSNNHIHGVVPNWLWKESLIYLNVANNGLSSLEQFSPDQSLTSQGSLPTPICNLSKLKRFNASYNNLSGQLPNCLGNMSALSVLDLRGNNFSGILPKFSKASQLCTLRVSENRLEGKLPRSLAECTQLEILDVGNNLMRDTFPFWLEKLPALEVLVLRENKFYGQIKRLGREFLFPALDVLDIASNEFSGELSIDFHQATHLRTLNLGGNKLEGKLPRSLANCTTLEVLDIGRNMVHDTFPLWLEKLPSLRVLILRGNRFYGTLKKADTERGFPKLRILDIASNNFSGDLSVEFLQSLKAMMQMTDGDKARPEYIGERYYRDSVTIFNKGAEMFYQKVLTIFTCLDLSNNSFHGRIPDEIQNLRSLIVLNLSQNGFSGEIPSALNNLKDLESLDLQGNNLSGQLPNCMGNMSALSVLDLRGNNLSGQLPNCMGNMSALYWLDLQGNNFSGILPTFSKSSELLFLRVSENRLEGKLPRSLAECTQLQVLDVGNNMMRDTFPFWLEKLPALEVLVLRENKFYGQIKRLGREFLFPALDVLDIASNEFSGELSIDFHQATHLRTLNLGGNKLEGKLPRSLANCTTLEVLDIGHNMVHDTFPLWLEKLPSLKVLILRGNRFYGTLKKADTERGFPKLRILDIASNNLSGDLSIEFLQSLKAMMQMSDGDKAKREYIGEGYYQDSVTIFNKGAEMFYQKVLTILTCLDLSNNSFHGRIPDEIQNLRSLMVLNLSQNGFSGEIPSALNNLKDLESLDLSRNKLSGKIPPQLTTLTFLAALNLSDNQLEGSIPQSNQFLTFTNDSYRGNSRLCGLPLSRKCNEVDVSEPPPPAGEDDNSWLYALSTWKIALIGYTSGLVAGLCIGFTVLHELGNKWVHNFRNYGKRNQRRRSR